MALPLLYPQNNILTGLAPRYNVIFHMLNDSKTLGSLYLSSKFLSSCVSQFRQLSRAFLDLLSIKKPNSDFDVSLPCSLCLPQE